MSEPTVASQRVQRVFSRIHEEQMAGIPVLNAALKVQTLGFQEYQGRVIGILITPWLMNLVMLPGEDDDWSDLDLGKKQRHRFPSGSYRFMVNEIDGMGKCQCHSLYSPMHEFVDQDHARAAAESFLDTLMVAPTEPPKEIVDEELLGRILRGEEESEVELDGFVPIEVSGGEKLVSKASSPECRVKSKLSRRELLRADFLGDA